MQLQLYFFSLQFVALLRRLSRLTFELNCERFAGSWESNDRAMGFERANAAFLGPGQQLPNLRRGCLRKQAA